MEFELWHHNARVWKFWISQNARWLINALKQLQFVWGDWRRWKSFVVLNLRMIVCIRLRVIVKWLRYVLEKNGFHLKLSKFLNFFFQNVYLRGCEGITANPENVFYNVSSIKNIYANWLINYYIKFVDFYSSFFSDFISRVFLNFFQRSS